MDLLAANRQLSMQQKIPTLQKGWGFFAGENLMSLQTMSTPLLLAVSKKAMIIL